MNVAPGVHQGAHSAYHFAQAVIQRGHYINSIFFYGQGIYNANQHTSVPAEQLNLPQAWNKWAMAHQIPLHVCTAAMDLHGLPTDALIAQATRTGLVNALSAQAAADRILVFHA